MASQTGTVAAGQALTLGVAGVGRASFSTTGTYSVDYPLGSAQGRYAIQSATTAQALEVSGGLMRLFSVSGTLTYTIATDSDAEDGDALASRSAVTKAQHQQAVWMAGDSTEIAEGRLQTLYQDPATGGLKVWNPAGQSFQAVTTQPIIAVYPRGASSDLTQAQEAADDAMAQGASLYLAEGDWDFGAGGLVLGTGVDLNRNGVAENAYRALTVMGAGQGLTRINVGANKTAFLFANDIDQVGFEGGVKSLSILGTGIGNGAIGIQMGGRSAVRSDLMQQMFVHDVAFDNLRTCMILDDVSGFVGTGLRLGRFKYGFEWGYNVDEVRITDFQALADETALNNAAATITSGQSTFTVSAAVAARLQVGMGINAPGRFPIRTYVGAINGTTITAANYNGVAVNALANGTTASFYTGRLFNFGTRVAPTAGSLYPSQGSPFVSPYWSTIYPDQAGRISCNNHYYRGLVNEMDLICDAGGGSHFNITFELYSERNSQMAVLGDSASTQQPYGFNWKECYAGFSDRLLGPWIEVLATTPNFMIEVVGCFNDSTPQDTRWFQCTGGFGRGRLVWERNNLQAAGTEGQFRIGNSNALYSASPRVETGGAFYLGSARKGDAIQAWKDAAWSYYGQDGLRIDLAGASKTVSNPDSYNEQQEGREFSLYVTAATGNTLTLGTSFKKTDGTNFGTIAAGTTGQTMLLRFIWNGTIFLGQNAAQWV